jgi:ABC-type transport system involved in multi-copper enzyme maturation permease subunit
MKNLIRAEFTKLLTTRGAAGILLGATAISVVAYVAPGENAVAELTKPLYEQQSFFFAAVLMRVLLLVLGIRAVTEELRHGTVTPSLLAAPRRGRLVAAKVASLAAGGAVIGLVAGAALVGSALAVAAVNGAELQISASDWSTFAGMTFAGAVWPVMGAGLGLIVRSQVAATVGGLVWLMAIEDMIRIRLDDLGGYLPGQAGLGLVHASTETALAGAGLVLATYAAAAVVGGAFLFRRRDVT